MVRISLFKSERVKRKYEQKKNLKWKTVLDTVKKNLSLIRIDQKKMQMLQEDNDEQKIQIRVQEEKITELNIKIDKSKKKLSDLKDENLSQEYVEYTKVLGKPFPERRPGGPWIPGSGKVFTVKIT